jgi:hypothetical protein
MKGIIEKLIKQNVFADAAPKASGQGNQPPTA